MLSPYISEFISMVYKITVQSYVVIHGNKTEGTVKLPWSIHNNTMSNTIKTIPRSYSFWSHCSSSMCFSKFDGSSVFKITILTLICMTHYPLFCSVLLSSTSWFNSRDFDFLNFNNSLFCWSVVILLDFMFRWPNMVFKNICIKGLAITS